MQRLRVAVVVAIVVGALPLIGESSDVQSVAADSSDALISEDESDISLSPIWGANIRQWSSQINKEAQYSGLDPDFIAAVIHAESNGEFDAVSYVGAVGLMGVMPSGPGLEWRPSPETLLNPDINLNWGVAILTEIIQHAGGDISAALAAYSGGWSQANSRVPREYAAHVLDQYARAVAVRSNVSTQISSRWTIATEIRRGHIPLEPLIFDDEPLSGLQSFGEHVVFDSSSEEGLRHYVKGFAVPLEVIVPFESGPAVTGSDTIDSQLMARLGASVDKVNDTNPRVILTCLPSLTRLRGIVATRWYAPTSCPSWHR